MIAIKGLIMMTQLQEQLLARHLSIPLGKLAHVRTGPRRIGQSSKGSQSVALLWTQDTLLSL